MGPFHRKEVSQCAGSESAAVSLAASPILTEIRHALAALVERGEETTIDLGAMPFGPGDLERLTETLGEGEVEATLTAGGTSRLRETGVSGVWMIEHLGENGRVQSRFVEVAYVPALLKTTSEDVTEGLAALSAKLGEDATGA